MSQTLREVVETRRRELRLSYGDIASAAGMPKSTVHKLATTPLASMPGGASLSGLAKGLGLPVSVLRDAAASELGVRVASDQGAMPADVQLLLDRVAALPRPHRRVVSALVDSLVEELPELVEELCEPA